MQSTDPISSSHFRRLQGTLKKKNSKGQWKERLCTLTDETFTALKTSKRGAVTEVKECFDVKLLESVRCDGDNMEICLINGEVLPFKGVTGGKSSTDDASNLFITSNVEDWRKAFESRIEWALGEVKAAVADGEKIHISGWLLKKSHNKYQLQMQDRFVKVQGSTLYYFKKEGDDKELGVVSLRTAEFLRPYDRSPDCKVFEIFNDGRLYSFQTETPLEMRRWIDVLTSVREGSKGIAEAEARAKALAATPLRIRIFDNDGISAFTQHILLELEELYPSGNSENKDDEEVTTCRTWSLGRHLQAAKAIHHYVDTFIPDIRYQSGNDSFSKKGPRFDVLAIFLVEVNYVLRDRLMDVLDVNSPQVENATLLELHSMIDWLTKYQQTMKRCHCPTSSLSSVIEHLPEQTPPNSCDLFDCIAGLCRRYVNGSESGNGGAGAASHLVDHCLKVWERLIANPSDMLQRHMDGSFYTAAPTTMWEALNQHLQLATSTQQPVLHVMIADKIATALQHIVSVIEDYVQTVDFSATVAGTELKEIELELLSALANDNALHLEEMISMVECFELDEIRARIDELFDPVTMALVKCGQTCLRRLSSLLYIDVEQQINEVFTEDWLEGTQLQVVTATLTDYMNDLQQYLMPFWTEKFIYILLEYFTLRYTKAVIAAGSQSNVNAIESSSNTTSSFFRGVSKMLSFKDKTPVSSSGSRYCRADSESLGRLAQDVNILNAFFSSRAGQDIATEFLGIINELSVMLFQSIDDLQIHVLSQIAVYPASATAIYDMARYCLRLRDDITADDIKEFCEGLRPALNAAPLAAEENCRLEVAEGRLGLLFADLAVLINATKQTDRGAKSATQESLAQKLKDMANVPLAALKKAIIDDEEEDSLEPNTAMTTDETLANEKSSQLLKRRQSVITKTTAGLVDDVLDVLQQQEEEIEAKIIEEEQLRLQEEKRKQSSPGIVSVEGHLDKKSPAHNLWQSRWFKIQTRENNVSDEYNEDNFTPYSYQLMWYKKKGGAVLKSMDCSTIIKLSIIQCNRPLAWLATSRRIILQSEVDDSQPDAMPIFCGDESSCPVTGVSASSSSSYVFSVVEIGGKEHILRASKMDKMIVWVNSLATVSNLTYDGKGSWRHVSATNPPLIEAIKDENENIVSSMVEDIKIVLLVEEETNTDISTNLIEESSVISDSHKSLIIEEKVNDSLELRSRASSSESRPIERLSLDGTYSVDNPVTTIRDSLTVRNPILAKAAVVEEVIDDTFENVSTPKTPRKMPQMKPLKIDVVEEEEDEFIPLTKPILGTVSPSSRSLFKKRMQDKKADGTVKPTPTPPLSPKSLGLALFHPSDLQQARIREAEEEWNKFYSDDAFDQVVRSRTQSAIPSPTGSQHEHKHVSFTENAVIVRLLSESSTTDCESDVNNDAIAALEDIDDVDNDSKIDDKELTEVVSVPLENDHESIQDPDNRSVVLSEVESKPNPPLVPLQTERDSPHTSLLASDATDSATMTHRQTKSLCCCVIT